MSPIRRARFACILLGVVPFLASHLFAAEAMKVEVDTTQIARHLLRCKITLPAKPGEFSFRHPEWIPGIHGPSEQIRNIAGLKVFDAEGKQLTWQRDPGQLTLFHVDVPSGDEIVVELLYLANQPTRVSTGVDSYGNADVLAINLNTCIVYPDGVDLREQPVDCSIKFPPDFKFATALREPRTAKNNTVEFARTTVETLVDSPVIAGRNYRRLDVTVPNFPATRYHYVSESSAALDFDEKWVSFNQNLMKEAYGMFGGAPFSAYDFLVVCSDRVPGMGLEHHESSLNGIDEGDVTDEKKTKGRASYLLGHELVHAWCGKYRRPAGMYREDYHSPKRTGELWIYEGLTQYLGQVLTARAQIVTFDEHKERIAYRVGTLAKRAGRAWRPLEDTAVAAYTLRGGSPSWTDLRRSQDYYDEGAFFWLEVDATLRRKSNGKLSLDDFCKKFFAYDEKFPKVKPFEVEEVVETLTGLVAYDWAGLIERRIRTAAPKLSFEGLRTAGYEFALVPKKPDYIKEREGALDSINATYSLGLAVKKKSGEISIVVPDSVADKANLSEDTIILGVNGMKFTPKRFEAAIEASLKKGIIELLVEHSDAYRVIELKYNEGPKYPSFERIPGEPDFFGAICAPRG